jgi:hypothetical protein
MVHRVWLEAGANHPVRHKKARAGIAWHHRYALCLEIDQCRTDRISQQLHERRPLGPILSSTGRPSISSSFSFPPPTAKRKDAGRHRGGISDATSFEPRPAPIGAYYSGRQLERRHKLTQQPNSRCCLPAIGNLFRRISAVLPIGLPASGQPLWGARSSAHPPMHSATPVGHSGGIAGFAASPGPSFASWGGSGQFQPRQQDACMGFIGHFWPIPWPVSVGSPPPLIYPRQPLGHRRPHERVGRSQPDGLQIERDAGREGRTDKPH